MFRPDSLPFSFEDYGVRRQNARTEMARRGIDYLYVSDPLNLLYLTGYEAIWYPPRLPVGALIQTDDARVTLFDWSRHAGYVETSVLCDDIVWLDYAQAVGTVCDTVRARSGGQSVVALEWQGASPAPGIVRALSAGLQAAGLKVVPGDYLIDTIRLYKSAAEQTYVRRAAEIADTAMRRLIEDIRPGLTAAEVSAHAGWLLAQAGSEAPAMPVVVNAGPEAWKDVHGFPSQRRLQAGDVINVDLCASVSRYHANLGRSFVLGERHTRLRAFTEAAEGSLGALQSAAVLDADPAPAARAAENWIRARVPAQNIWWVGGYALGLALPPGWVGHTYLANDGAEKCRLAAGYVSNFETVFIDRDEGFEGGCIDTLLMTQTGFECLSTLPRRLMDIGI